MTEIKESPVFLVKSLKRRIWEFMADNPGANMGELLFTFKDANPNTLKVYRSRFRAEYQKFYGKHHLEMKEIYFIIKHLLLIQATKVQLLHKLNKDERMAIKKGKEFLQEHSTLFGDGEK